MSRKNPQIFLNYEDPDSLSCLQVCESSGKGLYVVLYYDQPFSIRTKYNREVEYPGWKYPKVGFNSFAHAANLARKLNRLFNTDKFTVSEMSQGKHMPI